MGVNQFSCPDSQSVQFRKQFYGSPLDSNYSYDFKFKTDIPHFQREVNIDLVFFRGDGCNEITVQFDGGTQNQFEISYPFTLKALCDKSYWGFKLAYNEFEQLLKYRQNYLQNGNQILVHVNEKDTWLKLKALVISSIQININTCHQSCLTCKNSSYDSCTSCSQQANIQNGKCSCKNQDYFFQDGQCVPSCNNAQGYHQKTSSEKICTYVQNCLSWDINNQKCLKCQIQMLPQLDKCVKSCSSGFEQILNHDTQSYECLLVDRFKNGIEVDGINGLQIQGFMSQQNSDSIVSRCGDYQLLGGFIVNKQNSKISYSFTATGFNFVKVFFKYILIDIQKDKQNADSLIQVSLNNQKQNIKLTQSSISKAIDICGFSGSEIIDSFSLYDNSQAQNILTILNLNNFNLNQEYGSIKNIYLGVREISIYAFNCLQDNCQQCELNGTSTSCQICSSGYFLNNDGNCIKCNSTCLNCSNSISCTECLPIEGLSLNKNNNQCVCKDFFYFDSSKTICSPCQNNQCLTCLESDSTQCLSCIPPLALLGTACVSNCGTGMAVNQSTNLCQKCILNCSNCDKNLDSCNQCQNGYFFYNNQCILKCPDGFYGDVQNQVCIPCTQSECKICNNSKDVCAQCKDKFYVDINTNKCVDYCSNTQYIYQGYCKNCSQQYQNCISCDQNKCTQCSSSLVLSVDQIQCLTKCPIGTVQINQQCSKCEDTNCSYCDSSLVCQVCSSGFYLYLKQCQASCPSNYYPDQQNQCQICSSLFSNCQNCSSKQCNQCDSSSIYKYLDLNKSQCLQQCSIGQFSDSQNQCQQCQNTDCATCSQSDSKLCIKCDPNNSNKKIFLDNQGNCVTQCSSGYYPDNNRICQSCQKYGNQCIECNSQFCQQCETNYYVNIDSTTNLSTCISGNNPNTCTLTNCLVCNHNNNTCQVCQKGYFLQEDNQCVEICKPGYFQNQEKSTCDQCSQIFGNDCSECDQISCTKCSNTKQYIQGNICQDKCNDGYYAKPSEYICKPCNNSNCKTCDPSSPDKCQSCSDRGKSLLQNADCVIQCSEGFFQIGQDCKPCLDQCTLCNSSTQCLKCKSNYLIDINQSQCIQSSCPSGQYKGKNLQGSDACFECSKLFDNCIECTADSCQKCNSLKYLNTSNNTCSDSCPDNYYPNNDKTCVKCQNSQCKTCDASICLSCFVNGQYPYLNEKGNCVSNCENNEYLDEKNLICSSCQKKYGFSCSSCNSKACLKCANNQYISEIDNNSCVTKCPSGQYGNTQTFLCQNCENIRCNTCEQTNPNQCMSCKQEYPYLYNGNCLSQCQESFFADKDNTCQSCSKYHTNCNKCDQNNCISCSVQSNQYLLDNKCVDTCPDSYYPSQQDIKICKKCSDSNCKQCNPQDPSKCLNCKNSFLFDQTCVSTCPIGTFPNQKDNTCIFCYSKFSSCQECDETKCISCQNNLFILEDTQQCVSSCPVNYIDASIVVNSSQPNKNSNETKKKVCQKCANPNCNTCDPKDTSKCLSCPQNMEDFNNIYLYNQDCEQKCDFYLNQATNECFDFCPNYLFQIEQPKKQCKECEQFIQNKQCVMECTSNTYIDQTHKKLCVLCQDQYDGNCILCNSSKCLKCSTGFYLYQNKCHRQCPSNTFFDNENFICLDYCIDPQVIINNKECSKVCPSGQYKEQINSQNQIICGLCDKKCIECEKKSSFCTVCKQGSGWDCLDKEDFDAFQKIQYCEYLKEESEIEKCSQIITESNIKTYIIDITSYFSIAICLALILANHTFIGVYSIYYIQIFQLIGNYVMIQTVDFKIVNEVLTKYFLAFNIFNLIPQPFERENYSDLLTFFNYKTLILDIHNLSKNFYINNLYQLTVIFLTVIATVILTNLKHLKRIGVYFQNNIIPKLFLICSNMIILSSLNNIIYSTYLSTFDRILVYGSLVLYCGVFCYIIYIVYKYRIEATLIQNNLQKFFLVQSLEAHLSRRIFWILFELRKIFCCFFVVFYSKQVISIWVSIAISFIFIMFLTLYRPFSSKLESGFLVFLETIFLSSQIVLVFMSSLDSIQNLISVLVLFLLSCNAISLFLIGRKIYQLVQQKNNEFHNFTDLERIKMNEMSILNSFANSFDIKKQIIVNFKQNRLTQKSTVKQ